MNDMLDMDKLSRFYRCDKVLSAELMACTRSSDALFDISRDTTARQIAEKIVADKDFFSAGKDAVFGNYHVTCSAVILTPQEYKNAIQTAFQAGMRARI